MFPGGNPKDTPVSEEESNLVTDSNLSSQDSSFYPGETKGKTHSA